MTPVIVEKLIILEQELNSYFPLNPNLENISKKHQAHISHLFNLLNEK